jgi:hypothetical protein
MGRPLALGLFAAALTDQQQQHCLLPCLRLAAAVAGQQ